MPYSIYPDNPAFERHVPHTPLTKEEGRPESLKRSRRYIHWSSVSLDKGNF